jgi:hypothetical protein
LEKFASKTIKLIKFATFRPNGEMSMCDFDASRTIGWGLQTQHWFSNLV